jgi:hypothetical protein
MDKDKLKVFADKVFGDMCHLCEPSHWQVLRLERHHGCIQHHRAQRGIDSDKLTKHQPRFAR